MAKIKGFLNKSAHEPIFHITSIGLRTSLQKMNKHMDPMDLNLDIFIDIILSL